MQKKLFIFIISLTAYFGLQSSYPQCKEDRSIQLEKNFTNIYHEKFKDLLLVINFNHPYYSNIQFLKNLYSPIFENIVFYGEKPDPR